MSKYILILILLIMVLSSCVVEEKWSGIYCNNDGECKQFAGWIGHEFDSCPEMLMFDRNTEEQFVSVREIYYFQNGTCVD